MTTTNPSLVERLSDGPERPTADNEMVSVDEINTDIIIGALDEEIKTDVKDNCCCVRTKLMVCPIKSFKKIYINNDAEVHLIIVPEAFRMWFYYGFFIYTFLAIFVSLTWSTELDLTDNVFIDIYGGNNICLFYDFPPFSYFGAILWFPQLINALLYEIFDHFRVYDDYIENNVTKTFYIFYSVLTVFECIAFVSFLQVTATSPIENVTIHTIPFFMTIYALWSISFKRCMYIWKTDALKQSGLSVFYYYCGLLYVLLLLFVVIIKSAILWPNFFGAKLWTKPGLEWTVPALKYTVYLWMFLVLIAPIIIYSIITKELKTVTLVINRTVKKE